MKYIADLHVHSAYSMATSKKSHLVDFFGWAQVKGIHLVGTGDFTHPKWRDELKELLVPAEPGFYRITEKGIPDAIPGVSPENIPVRFMLSSEISCIYKKAGKIRKIHVILYVPDMDAVDRIARRLDRIGNIMADGRPILGLDVRDLLEILLETSEDGFMVPAHIWTPWFSLFGSKSGFDSIETCFQDLSDHIFALETGLSSDPGMNRLISDLDRFSLVSNSDCHSPAKLGREANLFDTEFDFYSLKRTLQNKTGFQGTLEFYPEEGKYFFDGHRKCRVCREPDRNLPDGERCPVCGKPMTIGVMNRVKFLADRQEPRYEENRDYFESLIPLTEILGEILKVGPSSKRVMNAYGQLISQFGSELNILRRVPIEDLSRSYSPILAEAVKRLRKGEVIKSPGFDGQFGSIRLFNESELDS